MSIDSIISLLLGIPIGVMGGLWSGIVVARYTRFSELRNEALRIIRRIDFMQDGEKIKVTNHEDISKFSLIASDFYFLKHQKAGQSISALSQDVLTINQSAANGTISMDNYKIAFLDWQNTVRMLSPKYSVILSLWGKL